MKHGNLFQDLPIALSKALIQDLPDVEVPKGQNELHKRRPTENEVDVEVFSQTWSSTALGFEAFLAGQAITKAYTIIVSLANKAIAVYFGQKLAYVVYQPTEEFLNLIRHKDAPSVSKFKANKSNYEIQI